MGHCTAEMFHSDEVNEEAILLAHWAYKKLHDTFVPIRRHVAISAHAWLLGLPYAIEILSQTHVNEVVLTEVGTTCIYYKDWETHNIRRSGPRYAELKTNDGVRLLARLLYHGMQE